MTTKDEPRAKVAALVGRFQALTPAQVRDTYQEANTRKDFVLGLFRALGWDTDKAEEVFEERKAGRGEVDYAFRIRGVSRFYLEAKPLREELASHPEWVNQAVSYAYNKSIPYVVLTNFKDLWVFNGDVQPRRFLTLRADQYLDDFELLWLLSKEATDEGSLEREAEKHGALPPRVSVERRLYENLAEWRGRLSRELHLYQPGLSLGLVDETVQRLFNRLIFIRSCEDRRIEEPVLQPLARQHRSRTLRRSLWDSLKRVFADFDRGYDSELFMSHVLDMQAHFQDDTLADVMEGLYGPPGGLVAYDFSVIDADVLGRVYEQYLGHVSQMVRQRHQELQARLDLGLPQDQALAETLEVIQRPQRRKAQGIYYTPHWVVDYIVGQTVGRFIQEHLKRPDAIAEMKVLDMACGSGSFLIRAYDALLQWEAELAGMPMEQLTQEYRMPVLRRNIFGVDLDQQAVEIARLNLLLRALRERQRLPELRENIKRGNSLISGGEAELRPFFGEGWREKQPFNWAQEIPEIMKAGGFDVVIGNPPYVRVDAIPIDEKRYYKHMYQTCVGKYDLYYLFFEKALSLVREGGCLAFITPNRFCTNSTGEKLRELIRSQGAEIQVASVSQLPVFEDAANYPVITIVHKTASQPKRLIHASPKDVLDLLSERPSYELTDRDMAVLPRGIIPINIGEKEIRLAVTIQKSAVPAKGFLKFHEGLRIPATYEQRRQHNSMQIPIIKQFQFSRYSPLQDGSYLSVEDFKLLFPRQPERVRACRTVKLVVAEDALRVEATLDASHGLCQGGVYFGVPIADNKHDIRYFLALLNSKLINFVYKAFYSGIHMGGGYLRFRTEYLQELPIKSIVWGKPEEQRQHDGIVGLVEEMLALQERLGPLRGMPSEERAELERHIAQVDRALDEAVYALYGLTDAERRLVEGEI